MQRMLILTGLLLAAGCGSDPGTSTAMVGPQAGGADPASPSPATTAEPNTNTGITGAQTTPAAETPTEGDATTSQPEPNPDTSQTDPPAEMTPADPNQEMSQTDPDPDMSPAEPDPDTSQTDPDPDMSPAEPNPEMMGEGTEADPNVETDGETPTPLSFATDIWPLWSMVRDPVFVYRGMDSYSGCSDETLPCHGSASPGAGLSMVDQETAYAQMMDTPSASMICAGTQRVVVGDPDNSCLILFYEGRLGKQDLDWVDDAEIELMREWIRQGALP